MNSDLVGWDLKQGKKKKGLGVKKKFRKASWVSAYISSILGLMALGSDSEEESHVSVEEIEEKAEDVDEEVEKTNKVFARSTGKAKRNYKNRVRQ